MARLWRDMIADRHGEKPTLEELLAEEQRRIEERRAKR